MSNDAIGAESVMKYLQQLGVNAEDCELFVVLDIVQAPSLGEITRQGFVEGWKATRYVWRQRERRVICQAVPNMTIQCKSNHSRPQATRQNPDQPAANRSRLLPEDLPLRIRCRQGTRPEVPSARHGAHILGSPLQPTRQVMDESHDELAGAMEGVSGREIHALSQQGYVEPNARICAKDDGE
jgi:hypothetical protein